jgi:ABC-type antimicrobial peptide transport system permease subunit
MGDAARLRKDALTSHGQKVIMSNISIYLKPGVDRDKFVKEYRNIVDGGGSVRKREEVFQSVMNMIAAPQQRAIPAVVVIVLTVGGISIFSIVLLQASKNHRNSSIYKCIGYSTGHLVCSNLIHTLIISLLATCIAVPICIAMYPYIMKICLMTFGLKVYPIQYTLKYALIANGSVIIIFILATLLSSRRLRKVDVRELIQE